MDQRSAPLTRAQIAEFIPSQRGILTFEALQSDTSSVFSALSDGQFLTLAADPSLGSERVLSLAPGELTGTDGGANAAYTLGLASVGTAGTTGANSKTIAVTTDAKGRVTAVTAYDLNTSNITEGSNLYYTDARARAAISAGAGISYNSTTGVITNTGGGGSYSYTVTSRALSYTETATSGDQVVLVTGAAVTVTLPTAVGNGARFTFKLTVAGTMTLSASGGQTIDGSGTASTSTQYTAITIVSDNANWFIV